MPSQSFCCIALGETGKRLAFYLTCRMRKLKSQKLFSFSKLFKNGSCNSNRAVRLFTAQGFLQLPWADSAKCRFVPSWGSRERSWFKMHIPNSHVSWLGIVTKVQIPVRYNSLFTRCRVGARVHSLQAGQGSLQREIWGISHKIMFLY